MDTTDLSRKEFIGIAIATLVATALGSACSSSDSSGNNSGTGTGGTSNGSGGAANASCTDPVSSTQEQDSTGHTHTLTIGADQISAGSPSTFTTSSVFSHTHDVTLTADDFASLKSGTMKALPSSSAGTPAHTHTFDVKCA